MTDGTDLFLCYLENAVEKHEFDAWKMIDSDNKLRICIVEHHSRSSDTQTSMGNDACSQAALLDRLDEWTLQAERQLMYMLQRNIHLRVRIVERRQQILIESQHVAATPNARLETKLAEVIEIARPQLKIEFDAPGISVVNSNHQNSNARPEKIIEEQASSLRTVEEWPCSMCKKILSTELALSDHEKYCLSDRTCDVCSTIFTLNQTRLIHIVNQHPEYRDIAIGGKPVNYESIQHLNKNKGIIRQCIVCKKQFAGFLLYRQHMKMHKEQGYPCEQCEVTLDSLNRWKLHKAQHNDEYNFVCDICSKRFSTKAMIYQHMRGHAEKIACLCNVCGGVFRSAHTLKTHMARKHSGRKRPTYSCHLCESVFLHEASLKLHSETHDAERKYECFECGKQATSRKALRNHIRRHGTSADFKCALCPRRFFRQFTLDNHVWTHNDVRRFSCSLCAKQFKSPHALKFHERIYHAARKLRCGICNKEYRSKSGLRSHRLTHDENRERKFKCDQCPMAFFEKQGFDYHIRSHRGDRPFSCSTCSKRYASAVSLKQHKCTHKG